MPGQTQPASVHALVHAMNEALGGRGQTYDLIDPGGGGPGRARRLAAGPDRAICRRGG